MPTLYTLPGTCALAPNIAVAWLDAPVEIENMAYGDQRKPSYLALNPRGKVPAVRFEDGDVLTEAAAILAWVGAAHGTADWARDTVDGRKEAEALSYMTSEVHADFAPHFAAGTFADGEAAQAEIERKAYDKLAGHYAYLEERLGASDGDWYLGRKSFADAYLHVLVRWIEQTPLSLDDYPGLRAHRDAMEADEAVRKALARQGMRPQGAAAA